MKSILIKSGFLSLITATALANPITIIGNVDLDLTSELRLKPQQPLHVTLPKVELSAAAHQNLSAKLQQYQRHGSYNETSSDLPSTVNIGMQGTPVLNQGKHGSCVTFAVTAAINAALGMGDYISQLCNLELGSYLALSGEKHLSGWNGFYGSWVFEQIDEYGVLSKNYQKYHGCAGVYDYPTNDSTDRGNPMSNTEFKLYSIKLGKLFEWQVIMLNEGWLAPETDMNKVVERVKLELAKGNRLTFGVLLDVKRGHSGALGQYHVSNDTWMLTPEVIKDFLDSKISAGHDMVIIGYDDDAIVYDDNGNTNKGVFYLRNSWSSVAGDNGNYYVSYDYFKYLTQEVHLVKNKIHSRKQKSSLSS